MNRWMLRQLAAAGVAFVFATGLSAQKLTVGPTGMIPAGSAVTLEYSDPSKAGQDIVIEVSGGFPTPSIEKVTIHLDAAGKGRATWNANGAWLTAGFNAPGCNEIVRMIQR